MNHVGVHYDSVGIQGLHQGWQRVCILGQPAALGRARHRGLREQSITLCRKFDVKVLLVPDEFPVTRRGIAGCAEDRQNQKCKFWGSL